jgi:hypothetical protein
MYGMQFVPHRERGMLPLAESINTVQESIGYCENPQKEHLKHSYGKKNEAFVGAFAKLQTASNSFVLSRSVRPHGTTKLAMDELS